MSQQDNFVGGFLTGAVVGGVVGGIVGVLVTSRLNKSDADGSEESFSKLEDKTGKARKRQLKAPTEQSIEMARRGLEDKIAQLNDAIDDVRQQLSGVNGAAKAAEEERGSVRDS
jgi:gas vesicle protein